MVSYFFALKKPIQKLSNIGFMGLNRRVVKFVKSVCSNLPKIALIEVLDVQNLSKENY